MHARSNPGAVDYVENDETEVDGEPHWSIPRWAMVPPLPRPVQVSAAQRIVALPPPLRAPMTFYSYAEHSARRHDITERVAPLPMSELESPWGVGLATAWQRFAAPACGLIAALILVVGYLAYSSQSPSIATAAAPAPAIVMPVEIAVTSDPIVEPAAASAASKVEIVPTVVMPVATKQTAQKKTKRRPVRFDASTPLGNLRPSRSF